MANPSYVLNPLSTILDAVRSNADLDTRYVSLSPTSSTRNVIQPTDAAYIPLIVKGAVSQSANLVEYQKSDGTNHAELTATGSLLLSEQSDAGYLAIGDNPASTGSLRLPYLSTMAFRNQTNDADVTVFWVSAGNQLRIGSSTNPTGAMSFYNGSGGYYFYQDGSTSTYAARIGTNFALFNEAKIDNDVSYYFAQYVASAVTTDPILSVYGNGRESVTIGALNTATGLTCAITNFADRKALVVKGYSSQTANLQEWQNSSGSIYHSIGLAGVVFNEGGDASTDFRVEGDTDANLLFVDASADSLLVGTNTATANYKFKVSGRTNLGSTGTDLTSCYGVYTNLTTVLTADLTAYHIGLYGGIQYGSNYNLAGSFSLTSGYAMCSLNGFVNETVVLATALTVGSASGGCFQIISRGGTTTNGVGLLVLPAINDGATASTITNSYGVLVKTPTGASLSITNYYGLYVSSQSKASSAACGLYIDNITGATNSFAIKTNAGNIVFNEGGDASTDFRVESDTEANMIFLDSSADTIYLGGTTTRLVNDKNGDTWWEGEGSGLPYGSIYGNDIAWTQATAVQNTWYEIADTDMNDGQLNLVTHDGSGKLTVTKAGRYHISYDLVFTGSVAGKEFQSAISVSGTENDAGLDHEIATNANAKEKLTAHAILDLAANATIDISIRTTDAGTPDITVEHLNVVVFQLGGT
jgi:hypothetical protein